jgi:hypothetical protein
MVFVRFDSWPGNVTDKTSVQRGMEMKDRFWPLFLLTVAMMIIGSAVGISIAKADPGCQDDLWITLQGTRRAICDGPMQSDGSWQRARVFYTPEHYVPQTTNCYGYHYISCNTSGGYFVPYHEASREVYVVTPETKLPDEPD